MCCCKPHTSNVFNAQLTKSGKEFVAAEFKSRDDVKFNNGTNNKSLYFRLVSRAESLNLFCLVKCGQILCSKNRRINYL